jgi:glycosyltransferase involved in cell wall biosynthesis
MLKLSVCIPTYNRAAYLREAIASALAQDGVDFEVIVSDNASTDDTAEVVREFDDPRLRYSRNHEDLGRYGNGQRLLELATGEYLTFLFDDDLMLPTNLAKKVRILDSHPKVGFVHSNFLQIDTNGSLLSPQLAGTETQDYISDGIRFFRRLMLERNLVCFPSVVMRRECIDKLGPGDPRFEMSIDFELWLRFSLHYDVAYLAEHLVKYRVHAGSHYVGLCLSDALSAPKAQYEARRLNLDRYREIVADPSDYASMKSQAAALSGLEAIYVGHSLLDRGQRGQGREALAFALRLHPALAVHPAAIRLYAKFLLGKWGTELARAVKRSVGA